MLLMGRMYGTPALTMMHNILHMMHKDRILTIGKNRLTINIDFAHMGCTTNIIGSCALIQSTILDSEVGDVDITDNNIISTH